MLGFYFPQPILTEAGRDIVNFLLKRQRICVEIFDSYPFGWLATSQVGAIELPDFGKVICGSTKGQGIVFVLILKIPWLRVCVLVVVMYLIDLIAPALKLPDWVHQLALTAHLGQPMVGVWDAAGIAACIVLAVGGLALAGFGMRSRDVAR